ncbi:MAG: metallophosphoesterase [Pirellulales bacterium]|nr:metallophosphoesterase [Pirellulales bacterium]
MVASNAYVERIVETYQQAAEAALATPGRRHGVVHLTAELADEVMITGDLHGHRDHFLAICRAANLAKNPRRHLILQEVCHGGPTYPENGGCTSHTLLEDVARLKTLFPDQLHFLLGNHELAELTEYPIQKNKQMLNLLFRLGLQHAYGPAAERVREAYLPFLEACPLAVSLAGGVFVSHSIPEKLENDQFDETIFTREIRSLEYYERSSIFDLVWGRDYRPDNARAFAQLVGARVLINGHEPCPDGFCVPNDTQIILDCCDDPGTYVILPVAETLSQSEIVERIQKLG